MTGKQIFESLWEFIINMSKIVGEVWDWLNEPIHLGIDILGLSWGVSFTPMMLTGGVLISLLVLGFIKAFMPVA